MKRRRTSARAYALRLLRLRPRSRRELLQRLQQRGYDPEEIARVLEELQAAGWLEDQEYLEAFIRGRLRKLWSPARIDRELRRQGFEPPAYRVLLDSLVAEEDPWPRLLERARRLRQQARDPEVFRRRLWGFLQRRGYAPEVFGRLLDALNASEAE